MNRIKHEDLFRRFASSDMRPTEKGREQFFRDQSYGKRPVDPDAYYLVLSAGKRAFDWLSRELYLLFGTPDWWGLHQLWIDWKGERWVLPHLLKWYKGLPDWIAREDPPVCAECGDRPCKCEMV